MEALKGNKQTFERELIDRHGKKRQVISSYVPIENNGEPDGFLVVVTDITAVKEAEKVRQGLELQLAESARLSTLGEMAGGIATQIRYTASSPSAPLSEKARLGSIGTLRGLPTNRFVDSQSFCGFPIV